MKAFIAAAIVSLGVTPLLGCVTAEQSSWKVLRQDAYQNRFAYDAASIRRSGSGTVNVLADSSGAKYLYEIDCPGKMLRILEGPGAAPERWFAVQAGSGDELLFRELCQ
ncbi:MAG TPA: hypothetical protein VK445_00835 [Dissulfurispiraceae bacterium]|nr:hypothetical protein [Dissulfurispiraceae bacterium]